MEKIDSKYSYDCNNCQSLCCVAPAFEKSEDFSISKEAEIPCKNISICEWYSCKIHDILDITWFNWCKKYSCFWAWEIVSQVFERENISWDKNPEHKDFIFETFNILKLTQELLKKIDENFELIKNLSQEVRWELAKIKYKLERAVFFYKSDWILKISKEEIFDDFFYFLIVLDRNKT